MEVAAAPAPATAVVLLDEVDVEAVTVVAVVSGEYSPSSFVVVVAVPLVVMEESTKLPTRQFT